MYEQARTVQICVVQGSTAVNILRLKNHMWLVAALLDSTGLD